MRVIISGSHGLVGSALVPFLTGGGHQVTRLVRAPGDGQNPDWDGGRSPMIVRALRASTSRPARIEAPSSFVPGAKMRKSFMVTAFTLASSSRVNASMNFPILASAERSRQVLWNVS